MWFVRRAAIRMVVGMLGLLPLPSLADAQEAVRDGLFVTVPNPIRDDAVNQIKQKIKDAVERKRRAIATVVFDFNPNDLPAGSSNFGSCSDLADYIRGLQLGTAHPAIRPTTVAFVHNEVTRHTVLPVLACSQIVMSLEPDDNKQPKARLGDVTRGLPEPLTRTATDAYRNAAERYPSPDLILRMIEPNLPLRAVKTEAGTRYASPERLKKWTAEGKRFTELSEVPPGLQRGNAIFDAPTARAVGLCGAFYDTRADLAAALKLPRSSLSEDWLVGRQVVPWRLDVTGTIDRARVDSLRRRIHTAVGRGANLLILNLDSPAGETAHVASLAQEIRRLKDRAGVYPVKTIAYVPPGRSLGAGCFLAVACDEIVLGDNAVLADFNYLHGEPADALKARREALLPLVKEQGYPEALFRAALEPHAVLVRVRSKTDPGVERLVTEDQFREDQASQSPELSSLGRIAPASDEAFIQIDAALAKEWRIAQATGVNSPEALYALDDLPPDQVRVSRDDLLDRVAEFFREPLVNFLLIMVGIVGLILELKMPGTTFPGAISAICFVLFFWAYSFVGEFTLLAVLLFLLGLVLIGVEIFLVPGLGFSGVAGVVLVITSLALVTLQRWPETAQDWLDLGSTVSLFAMSLAAAIVAAFAVAWFLPSIPFANRMVLQPPGEEEGFEDVAGDTAAGPLLGAIGVAATPLRPAGKAQIGDDFLDVVAEGDYVSPGTRVQVIEIEGNRIVVKEV
jgi:membrane-bound ClpP family serine protease